MMSKFFADYRKSIVNSVKVAELGTIASVNGSTADVNVQGYPLLVNVPLIDASRDIEYKRGDRVLVVFTKGDINGAAVVGGGISLHECCEGEGGGSGGGGGEGSGGGESGGGSSEDIEALKKAIEELKLTKANKEELYNEIAKLEQKKADKDNVVTSVNGMKGDVIVGGGEGGGAGQFAFEIIGDDLYMHYQDGTTPPNLKIEGKNMYMYF